MRVFVQRTTIRAAAFSLVAAALVATISPGSGQLRQGAKNRIVDAASAEVLNMIRTSSCADFAASLAKRKSGGSGSRSGMSRIKNDAATRTRFVDSIAGPLVNKMIDCDLLPSGHS